MTDIDYVNSNHSQKRVSHNMRIDADKFSYLENQRRAGFGFAATERNRADVYNEFLGYGIQVHMLRMQLGERTFERLWRIVNRISWDKLDMDKVDKMLSPEIGKK